MLYDTVLHTKISKREQEHDILGLADKVISLY